MGADGGPGTVLYVREGDHYALPQGMLADHPVASVDWDSAMAFAKAAGTGEEAWRLPCELEWEKFARGVDGRFFPWGWTHDPSWACTMESHAGPPTPVVVGTFAADESPYGVRDLSGGVRDWCLDAFAPTGPTVTAEGRLVVEVPHRCRRCPLHTRRGLVPARLGGPDLLPWLPHRDPPARPGTAPGATLRGIGTGGHHRPRRRGPLPMSNSTAPADLVLVDTIDGVTTLKMNMPARLNGWTAPMIAALRAALAHAGEDADTRAVVLTGTDPYYSAGVDLGGALKLQHPRALHAYIVEHNQALFDAFITFPKPILVAVNGPAIGACVTSATLCDGIIASEKATFSTPFAVLSVPPEGCSSVHLPRLVGEHNARRILGEEAWKPTGAEAHEIGLAQWVVPHEELMPQARRIARGWVEAGATRSYLAGATRDELLAINARESVQVATAFLDRPFLRGQFEFLWRKKKAGAGADVLRAVAEPAGVGQAHLAAGDLAA